MSEKPVELSADTLEAALRDLRAECVDEVREFTPEEVDLLRERMLAEMKKGPILLTGRKPKGRAAD